MDFFILIIFLLSYLFFAVVSFSSLYRFNKINKILATKLNEDKTKELIGFYFHNFDKEIKQINSNISILNENHKKFKENTENRLSEISKQRENNKSLKTIEKYEKLDKTSLQEMIDNFNEYHPRDFSDEYKSESLDITNANNVFQQGEKIKLSLADRGRYIAVKIPEQNNRFYVFYDKGKDIKFEKDIKEVFNFPEETEENKSYEKWSIIEPAIASSSNGVYSIEKKGEIKL